MFCTYTRPGFQVSVYRTIGSLVAICDLVHNVGALHGLC